MELEGMDFVAIIAGVVFLMALGFAIYFNIQDKKEKGNNNENRG